MKKILLAAPLAIAMAIPMTANSAFAASQTTAMATPVYAPITVAEVEAAQQAWGNALVSIAKEYESKGQSAAEKLAGRIIDSAYGYNMGPVLFKPTLANGEQTFRTTRDGALSYFVGGNSQYANDSGFALKGWRSVEIKNAGILIAGNTAKSMGHVSMTDKDGKVTTVDKTWGYVRDGEGKLRIVLHHSSLPFGSN
ncbi:MAG: phosphoribosyl-AMP cyclohydrolase [Sphingomonadales bacterium]|nr:phosphoribosyl-AMP cyclohydrolase [Sphingomonadales bacterium]